MRQAWEGTFGSTKSTSLAKHGFSTQKSYVVYGRSSQQSNLNLAALGSNGVVISGGGIVVNGVGDMNRDGFPDMMITNYVTSFTAFNAFIFVYPSSVQLNRSLLLHPLPVAILLVRHLMQH
jgi:hypothetical protein